MRVGVQWSLAAPEDWQWVEVTARRNRWASLPKRPVPSRGAGVSSARGWVNGLLCQGIVMRGFDHYAVEPITDPAWGEGLRFTLWQDGPDFATGERWATVWELFDPAPDPAFGGAVNTRQRRTVYAEANAQHPDPDVRPWAEFVPPAEEHVRHGVWLSDEAFAAHHRAAPARGWREWIA
jgi:hypothetical protein